MSNQARGVGYGPVFETKSGTVFNRTGATLVVGDIVMTDQANVDTGNPYTSYIPGNALSTFSNVINPATRGLGSLSGAATPNPGFVYGVVTNLLNNGIDVPGADNALVEVQYQGFVMASCVATAITAGVPLVAANGVRTLTPTYTVGNKVIAYAYQPNGSAAGVYMVLFDGIHGFGQMEAS